MCGGGFLAEMGKLWKLSGKGVTPLSAPESGCCRLTPLQLEGLTSMELVQDFSNCMTFPEC